MIKSYDLCKMAAEGMRNVLCVLLFTISFVSVFCDVPNRKITLTPMPGCDTKLYKPACDEAIERGYVVVFATAYAKGDSLLYAFSNIGMPTVTLARVTSEHSAMHFNWTKFVNDSSLEEAIIFDDPTQVQYRMALAFPRLLEYNDEDDKADLQHENSKPNNASYWKIRDFNAFHWALDKGSVTENAFVLTATSEQGPPNGTHGTTGNWSISFKFTVQGDSGRSSELPSLKYGANETQFDFVISNFTPSYASSRFAVETILVSQSTSEMKVQTTESIDDEYSPGVFQIVNWLSNPSDQQSSGFVQWKPVCYTSNDRSRSTATKVKNYNLLDLKQGTNMTKYLNSSIILSIFGSDLYNEKVVTARATNISFGLSQDRFYDNTNYTVWSASIGYGTPSQDAISLTVIVTIAAGLGLPVIILILGGVYTCVKKRRSKNTEYQPITETVDRNQTVIN